MKQKIIFSLVIILLLSLCACRAQEDKEITFPVNFYYCTQPITYNSSNAVISAEVREADGQSNNRSQLFSLYLQGPISDQYRSPFPAGLQLVELTSDSSSVNVVLSDQLAKLSGIKLTIACACIAMTLQDLYQIDSIQIGADSELLDGNPCIIIDSDNLVFMDKSTVSDAEKN